MGVSAGFQCRSVRARRKLWDLASRQMRAETLVGRGRPLLMLRVFVVLHIPAIPDTWGRPSPSAGVSIDVTPTP